MAGRKEKGYGKVVAEGGKPNQNLKDMLQRFDQPARRSRPPPGSLCEATLFGDEPNEVSFEHEGDDEMQKAIKLSKETHEREQRDREAYQMYGGFYPDRKSPADRTSSPQSPPHPPARRYPRRDSTGSDSRAIENSKSVGRHGWENDQENEEVDVTMEGEPDVIPETQEHREEGDSISEKPLRVIEKRLKEAQRPPFLATKEEKEKEKREQTENEKDKRKTERDQPETNKKRKLSNERHTPVEENEEKEGEEEEGTVVKKRKSARGEDQVSDDDFQENVGVRKQPRTSSSDERKGSAKRPGKTTLLSDHFLVSKPKGDTSTSPPPSNPPVVHREIVVKHKNRQTVPHSVFHTRASLEAIMLRLCFLDGTNDPYPFEKQQNDGKINEKTNKEISNVSVGRLGCKRGSDDEGKKTRDGDGMEEVDTKDCNEVDITEENEKNGEEENRKNEGIPKPDQNTRVPDQNNRMLRHIPSFTPPKKKISVSPPPTENEKVTSEHRHPLPHANIHEGNSDTKNTEPESKNTENRVSSAVRRAKTQLYPDLSPDEEEEEDVIIPSSRRKSRVSRIADTESEEEENEKTDVDPEPKRDTKGTQPPSSILRTTGRERTVATSDRSRPTGKSTRPPTRHVVGDGFGPVQTGREETADDVVTISSSDEEGSPPTTTTKKPTPPSKPAPQPPPKNPTTPPTDTSKKGKMGDGVECPLCGKEFAHNVIEEHADRCTGADDEEVDVDSKSPPNYSAFSRVQQAPPRSNADKWLSKPPPPPKPSRPATHGQRHLAAATDDIQSTAPGRQTLHRRPRENTHDDIEPISSTRRANRQPHSPPRDDYYDQSNHREDNGRQQSDWGDDVEGPPANFRPASKDHGSAINFQDQFPGSRNTSLSTQQYAGQKGRKPGRGRQRRGNGR